VLFAAVGSLALLASGPGCSTLELNRRYVVTKYARAGVGEGVVQLPSGKLHYFDGGAGPGRTPLVLIHGFGLGALETWEKQIPQMARRYRVIAPDLYGFGQSQPSKTPETAAEQADAVVELLDRLGIRQAHVVGVSFGGYVALQMSLRHSGRVGRLVLLDSAGLEPTAAERRTVAAHFPDFPDRASVSTPSTVPALRRFLGRMFYRTKYYPDFVLRDVLRAMQQSRELKQRIARRMHTPGGMLQPPELGRVRAPTMLVWGRHDPVILPSMGQRMAAAIPGSRLEWLEQSSHTGMIEEPARFNRLLLDFLDGRGTRQPGPTPIPPHAPTVTVPAPPSS
jgi:3-oxoadipate enol-lactonase